MSGLVFISHSEKDQADAKLLLTALEALGTRCWIAPRDIPPGGSYAEAILTAIEQSTCFVLIYTNRCNESRHVLREVERALSYNVNMVPVRFDDSVPSKSLDYLLATVHWLSVPAGDRSRAIKAAANQIAACASSSKLPSASGESRSDSLPQPTSPRASRRPAQRIALLAMLGLLLGIGVVIIFLLVSRNANRTSAAPQVASASVAPVQPASQPTAQPTAAKLEPSAPGETRETASFSTPLNTPVPRASISTPSGSTSSQPWLIPDSSVRRLNAQDLSGYSKEMLWRARNEIYARHGFIFHSDRGRELARSLGNQYRAVDGNETRVEHQMNDIEKVNVTLLGDLEKYAPPP